ncbi:MAG TPA: hypothetical protein VH253_02735 [Phycisphaerae bacterium]|nr:hypothetical protein [Phycisphaerae bacterium]
MHTRSLRTRPILALALLFPPLFSSSARADAPSPFAGTFSNDKLTVQLDASPASPSAFSGTFTLGPSKFPATATLANHSLSGTFTASGNPFPFTATLDGDRLILVTAGTTYALTRAGHNPLAADNPLAANAPAANAPAGDAATNGFLTLGTTKSGQVLFLKLPAATSLESGITRTADELATRLDAKPTLSGAFEDAKTHSKGGALFTAKLKGADMRGWIFCSNEKSGMTASVILLAANAPTTEITYAFSFLPIPVALHTFTFPDNSGSIDVPDGWTVNGQTLSDAVNVKGPANQNILFNATILVQTPDGMLVRQRKQLYQMQLQNYQTQMQMYRQSLAMHQRNPIGPMMAQPQPPAQPDLDKDFPGLLFCPYCDGPEEVIKNLFPLIAEMKKAKGLPYTTIDKVIELVPAPNNPSMPASKSGIAYMAVTNHLPDNTFAARTLFRITTAPVGDGKDSWMTFLTTTGAPDATFDADLPTMNAILASIKPNMDVLNKISQQRSDAIRKMGEDNERAILQRGQQFQHQQADNFNRFENQIQAQEQARHDSASDYIEYIRGVRDVYDTQTGHMGSADLNNVNGIVQGMNDAANDPNRFVQIPLRYER